MTDTSEFGQLLSVVESDLIHASNNLNDLQGEEATAKVTAELITVEVHIDTALQIIQKLQRDRERPQERDYDGS